MVELMTGLVEEMVRLATDAGNGPVPQVAAVVREALDAQVSPVGAVLDSGLVSEEVWLARLAGWLGMPWWGGRELTVPGSLRDRVPARVALRFKVLPVMEDQNGLHLVLFDPFNFAARQMIRQQLKCPIVWGMATRRQVVEGLKNGYGVGADTIEQVMEGRDVDDALAEVRQETTDLDEEDNEASVVKFVNQIIREALQERATDIHLEPMDDDLRIRYRIDGVLHEVPVPSRIKLLRASVISRIKIMAHLDIAERRMPQDGRINLEMEGKPIDVRVATIPSVTGESVSLRLLGQERFDFSKLGLDHESEQKVRGLLAQPNGIVLLTGPTGCGKSTSLYTFLSAMNTQERRIVTIEDPVENIIPGVVQIAVKPEINLTFAAGLRSILRGDPNVVMVGEMRDLETTEIAIRAALTGHLVFSTLHTNDAIGGIIRLLNMGVEPFLVASAVRAFIAQRLVRRLCPECAAPADYPLDFLSSIGFPLEYASCAQKSVGCPKCRHTGFVGRTAIYEICVITPAMQELITQRASTSQLRVRAIKDGMIPLRQYGWRRVVAGETTVEEVLRVTAADGVE